MTIDIVEPVKSTPFTRLQSTHYLLHLQESVMYTERLKQPFVDYIDNMTDFVNIM